MTTFPLILVNEPVTITVINSVDSQGGTLTSNCSSYTRLITSASLTVNTITISHQLNTLVPIVSITDNLGHEVDATSVSVIDPNTILVSLEGYTPIQGFWYIKII